MDAIKVDIAVACNYSQYYKWWSSVFLNILREVQHGDIEIGRICVAGSAVPDNTKNRLTGVWAHEERRSSLTDINRNNIVGLDVNGLELPDGFWQSDAEWVMWLDDDTVPPPGAIRKLIDLQRDVVAGLYFMGEPPHHPLAYVRTKEGFYRGITNYVPGTLTEVDAVGMGCTLVNKSVYQRIMDTHDVFVRPTAGMMAIPKADVISDPYFTAEYKTTTVVNNNLIMPLVKPADDDNRPWPFYAMEYMRTEDLHFAELCRSAGIKIYMDTTITCDHWKMKAVNYNTYREHLDEQKKSASA